MPRKRSERMGVEARVKIRARMDRLSNTPRLGTFEAIAECCGIHAGTLTKYLNGELGPPVEKIIEFAALDVVVTKPESADLPEVQVQTALEWLADSGLPYLADEVAVVMAEKVKIIHKIVYKGGGAPLEGKRDSEVEKRFRLREESQFLASNAIDDFCDKSSEFPLIAALIWTWSPSEYRRRLGWAEVTSWVADFLTRYPRMYFWGVFALSSDRASEDDHHIERHFYRSLTGREISDDTSPDWQNVSPEHKGLASRLIFFKGGRLGFSSICDYMLFLPIPGNEPIGFAAHAHEALFQQAKYSLHAARPKNPGYSSTLIAELDRKSTLIVCDKFDVGESKSNEAELPWSITEGRFKGWRKFTWRLNSDKPGWEGLG